MKFAVIDIETTGLDPATCRITEVGVVIIEDFQQKSMYTRLVNPGTAIPDKITLLTDINNRLVEEEPGFDQIADELNELTRDCIVIGHHVQFDYSFLKNEMKRAGVAFTRKTLCTAEFAQLLYPGRRTYALAALCRLFAVTNQRPHRALPDAQATAEIFLKMVSEKGLEYLETIFSNKSVSKLIPAHLRETVYKKLPQTPGVYYFIGRNNKPLYIGKAAKIKNRVLSHFRGEGNSLKILALAAGIKEIRYQETGNELLASLLEDHEIRHYWPGLNAAQKKNITRFGIVYYQDQLNRWRMGITRAGKQHCLVVHFHQYHLATEFVREKVQHYRLDSALCGLPSGVTVDDNEHNRNFQTMVETDRANNTAHVYLTKGRSDNEQGFIWIEKGRYKGFGFVSGKEPLSDKNFLEQLTLRYSSITSENIIGNLVMRESPSMTFQLK